MYLIPPFRTRSRPVRTRSQFNDIISQNVQFLFYFVKDKQLIESIRSVHAVAPSVHAATFYIYYARRSRARSLRTSQRICLQVKPLWKSRYQGTNFCQAFLGNVTRSWQKFAPWYLLFHIEITLLDFSFSLRFFSSLSSRPVRMGCTPLPLTVAGITV